MILVLGGTGFIGKNICHALAESNYEVVSFDRDSTSFDYSIQSVVGDFFNDEMLFSWVDKPDYVRFDHGPIPATEEITADPDNLIVLLGAEYILRSKLKFAHPLIIEQEHMAYLIPENLPNVIIRNSCTEGSVAAKLLWQWMSGGNAPEESHHYISQSTVIAKNF